MDGPAAAKMRGHVDSLYDDRLRKIRAEYGAFERQAGNLGVPRGHSLLNDPKKKITDHFLTEFNRGFNTRISVPA